MRLSPIASGRGGNIPLRRHRVKAGMRWKSNMHAFRFLTIFAAAIAAWMVFMWFTLAAVSASEGRSSDQTLAPSVPAVPPSSADEPALPAEAIGAGWIFGAGLRATPAGAGGVA